MIKKILLILITSLILIQWPTKGVTQSFLSLDDVAKITLLPGWRTKTGTHMAAVRIEMAEGWKTYWRSAGESGITPQFDWSGSENLDTVEILWPTPKVFDPEASRSYGYKGVLVIPIEITPGQFPNDPIVVRVRLDIGVCEDICVPMNAELQAELPLSGKQDPAILASLANRPKNALRSGLTSAVCKIEPISDGLRISAELNMPNQGGNEIVVFELPDKTIWIDEAQSTRDGRRLTAITDLVPANGKPFMLVRSQVRMTVFGKKGAIDIMGCSAS